MHQPMVPFHLHKGVGWAREENPCICNHLLPPMTTTGCLQPFLQPFLLPLLRQESGWTPTTLKAQAHLKIHPCQNSHSQLILASCFRPRRASGSQLILTGHPTPAKAGLWCPLTPALSLPSSPHPRPHCRSISQPTQGHGPHHRSATIATSATKMPPSHSALVAPISSCTNCHPQSHQHRNPINKSHLVFLHMPSPCG